MRLTRIYVAQSLQPGVTIFLETQASHHVQHVLRLKTGDPLLVFDGQGNEYKTEIINLQKSVQVVVKECTIVHAESSLHIHLGQAISRGEKMDYTLQKSAELGVKEITPLFTTRCGVKLSAERLHNKVEHWQKIIIAACEQSGRSYLPCLNPPLLLSDWLKQQSQSCKLLLHPYAQKNLKSILPPDDKICLLVGAEGGFSDDEVMLAQQAEFNTISLGPRILRTETAALAAIAALQCLWGDMG